MLLIEYNNARYIRNDRSFGRFKRESVVYVGNIAYEDEFHQAFYFDLSIFKLLTVKNMNGFV